MTVALEEFAQWRDSVEARLATLEAASDRHAAHIAEQRGLAISLDVDINNIQAEFRAPRGMLQALQQAKKGHVSVLREQRTCSPSAAGG